MEIRLALTVLFCIILQQVTGESAITQIWSVTEFNTSQFRKDVVKQILESSEIMVALDRANQDDTRVVYDRAVSAGWGTFYVNEDRNRKESCSYGPMFHEGEPPVYKHKRDLTAEEGHLYEKWGKYSPSYINGLNANDLIRMRTIVVGNDTTTAYVVINPIERVFFSCDEGHFCCGLYCCSRYINSFLKNKLHDTAIEKGVNLTIYNQLQFSVEPHYDENMTHVEQCQFLLFPNDDYYEDTSNITSVYYRCLDKDMCCAKDHCCLKPDNTIITIVLIVIGVITLLGVILLLYCCCFKDSSPFATCCCCGSSSAKQDYTMGRRADEDL